jgi:hypothetical protein
MNPQETEPEINLETRRVVKKARMTMSLQEKPEQETTLASVLVMVSKLLRTVPPP